MQLVPSMRAIHLTYVQSIRTFGNLLVWPWDDPIEGDWKYMNLCAGQSIGDLHHCKRNLTTCKQCKHRKRKHRTVSKGLAWVGACVGGGSCDGEFALFGRCLSGSLNWAQTTTVTSASAGLLSLPDLFSRACAGLLSLPPCRPRSTARCSGP